MTERQKQRHFLRQLMGFAGTRNRRDLQERMQKAEHDEKCVRSALILVGVVGLVSLLGLAYAAVLLPEFFDNTTPLLVKLFCALALGSLICALAFLGVWIWYRAASNRLHDECRQFVMEILQRRLNPDSRLTSVEFGTSSEMPQHEPTSAALG